MIGKPIYFNSKAAVSALTIFAMGTVGGYGSIGAMKQINDVAKSVAFSIANSSTSGTIGEPEVPNMVIGPAHRVVQPEKLGSDGWLAESTGGSVLFTHST